MKHKQTHENTSTKKCHYFNNNLTCPFEEMGCMFAHVASDICKFDQKCSNNLCSFTHSKVPEEEPVDEHSENDNESESEDNELDVEPCESCGQLFDDIEDLIDHYGTTGHLK